MSFWVNRRGRYPYTNRDTWITRAWLLIRKVDRQAGVSSYSDRRVAVELLRLAPAGTPGHLMSMIEEVINGSAEERPRPQDPSPETSLGEDR